MFYRQLNYLASDEAGSELWGDSFLLQRWDACGRATDIKSLYIGSQCILLSVL